MMKKISFAVYAVIGLIVILLLARAGLVAVDGGNFDAGSDSPLLKKGIAVGQTFKAPDNFAAIGVKLNTFDMRDIGAITLDVYDKPGGKLLAEIVRDDPTFPNGETIIFAFKPLPKGKYYFEIKDNGYVGKAPAVWMSNEDIYKEGYAFTNFSVSRETEKSVDKNIKGDLWFQTYKRYPFFSFLGLTATRLSRDWFKFIPKPVYIILFGSYILLAVFLVGYIINLRLHKHNS